MLRIHGKVLVRNFKKAVEDAYGLRLKVHQGFSRGQFADEDGTLAAARSEQAVDAEGSLELRPDMTVRQAKDHFREVAGFGIQVLLPSGANADDDSLLSAVGFKASGTPAAPAAPAAGASEPAGGEISVTGQKKLSTIQSEFTARFAQLGLMFFSLEEAKKSERGEHIRPLSSDQTVASVRTKAAKGDMSIHGNTTVGTIESGFRDDYGLYVQVCYMRDGRPVYTADSLNAMSLSELNRRAGEQGRGAFAYPKH